MLTIVPDIVEINYASYLFVDFHVASTLETALIEQRCVGRVRYSVIGQKKPQLFGESNEPLFGSPRIKSLLISELYIGSIQ